MDLNKLINIKILLFDLEGVLILPDEINNDEGFQSVSNEIETITRLAHEKKKLVGIITARPADSLTKVISELNFDEILTSSLEKITPAKMLLNKYELNFENLLYIGDDILDLPLMGKAGVSACPASSRREVKRTADYISRSSQNRAVIFELLELLGNSD